MKVTCKSDSEDVRIYIDGLLHLRFPRDKNVKIHAWVEGHSKTYNLSIWSAGHSSDTFQYHSRQMWATILKLLDKHI